MPKKPTQAMIAAALHVSPGRVSQLVKAGMPTWSLDAATAWKSQRVAPARGARRGNATTSSPKLLDLAAVGAQVNAAMLAGQPTIVAVQVAALRKLLRVLVREVPFGLTPRLPARVWVALLDYLLVDDVRLRDQGIQDVTLTPTEVAKNIGGGKGVWSADLVLGEACDWRDWSLDFASTTEADECTADGNE